MIVLTLPYPVSANRYWRAVTNPGRVMMVPTKEAKAYKEEVGFIARRSGLAAPMTCRVELWLRLYPARPQDWAKRAAIDPQGWDDSVRCIDLGNAEKVLGDALQGIVFENDRQVWAMHKQRMEPDGKPARVLVAIKALPARQPAQHGLQLGQAA